MVLSNGQIMIVMSLVPPSMPPTVPLGKPYQATGNGDGK